MFDSQLDVSAQLFRKADKFQFLSLFGGVAKVLFSRNFCRIYRTLRTAKPNPDLFIKAVLRIGKIDGKYLAAFLVRQAEQVLYLLNSDKELDLLNKRFIVFELDVVKDNPILFPVVTIIIMETFINKMRRLQGIRKMILIEEAWKAIAKEGMANYIRYLFKTVRKFYGEAVVVTQEVDDIISSPVVKETIINNSDCKILVTCFPAACFRQVV